MIKRIFSFIKKLFLTVVIILVIGVVITNVDFKNIFKRNSYNNNSKVVVNNDDKKTEQQTSEEQKKKEEQEKKEKEEQEKKEKEEQEQKAKQNSVRTEFRKSMESYEAFFDEYIALTKKLSSGDMDMSTLTKYYQFLEKYDQVMKDLDAIDENELTEAELQLYIDTMTRIENKLLKAGLN